MAMEKRYHRVRHFSFLSVNYGSGFAFAAQDGPAGRTAAKTRRLSSVSRVCTKILDNKLTHKSRGLHFQILFLNFLQIFPGFSKMSGSAIPRLYFIKQDAMSVNSRRKTMHAGRWRRATLAHECDESDGRGGEGNPLRLQPNALTLKPQPACEGWAGRCAEP